MVEFRQIAGGMEPRSGRRFAGGSFRVVVISADWRFLDAIVRTPVPLAAVVQVSWGKQIPSRSPLSPIKTVIGRGQEGMWRRLAKRRIPLLRLTASDCAGALPELLSQTRANVGLSYKNPIFPSEVLEVPPLGIINLHPSLLPAYRGALPLVWMAQDYCLEGGVTVHEMSRRADRGAILAQAPFQIRHGMSEDEIEHELIVNRGVPLAIRTLEQLAAGERPAQPQPSKSPTPVARFKSDSGIWEMIDWSDWSLAHLHHFLRQRPFWEHRLPTPCGWRRHVRWEIGEACRGTPQHAPGDITPTRLGYRIEHRDGFVVVRPRPSVSRLMSAVRSRLVQR